MGLLGHSEGGMLAAMVASRDPGVAFVIALAPPVAEPMEGLLLQERRMLETAGLPAPLVEERVAMTREVLALTLAQDWLPLERLIRATVREQLQALPEAQRAAFGDPDQATERLVAQTMTQQRGWMHFFLTHDARGDWARLHAPALVLFGGRDVQVDLELHRDALSSLDRPNVEIVTVAGANHLFQEADTGSVLEYAELAPELTPEVLRSVSAWLAAQGVGGDR
ncbi:MAG: alpha/beta hydrolase [Trueperaceae bacterium]|nr:alpha/beta hydrolase [Trueperaceae bacterium]